jgi:hypothetical protein
VARERREDEKKQIKWGKDQERKKTSPAKAFASQLYLQALPQQLLRASAVMFLV